MRKRRITLALTLAAALGASMAVASCSGRSASTDPPRDTLGEGEGEGEGEGDEMPRDGAEAYAVACGSCHGERGGAGPDAPQIMNPHVDYATWIVRNGHDVMPFEQAMPAFTTDELNADELDSVLTFLRSQPKPTTGSALFERMCVNCHGANGVGGRVDESIAGEELDEIFETVREGHHFTNPGDREYMPAFTEDDLSDSELSLIATFVATLPGGHDGDDDHDDDDDHDHDHDHDDDDDDGD